MEPQITLSKTTAYQAHDVLAGARTWPSLAAAAAHFDLLVGTTAKPRVGKKEVLPAAALPKALAKALDGPQRVAVVFGGEENGLSNSDLALCDWVSRIPAAVAYPSLNLSHAVMVYAYEWYQHAQIQLTPTAPGPASGIAMFPAFKSKLKDVLAWLSVTEHPTLYKRLTERALRMEAGDQKLALALYRYFKRKMDGKP